MNAFKTLTLLAPWLVPGLASPALATDNTQEQVLEEVSVSASRYPIPLRQMGASVSVVNEKTLELHSKPTLADVLRTVPAVTVSSSGGEGAVTTLRIRGEEGFRTMVLVDGINVADVSGPQVSPRLENLANAHISRVEVLRGPQGMMYGADAGGVISIFTRPTSAEPRTTVVLEGGKFGHFLASLNTRGQTGVVDYSLAATRQHTDGFNAQTSDSTEDNDGFDNETLHANIGVTLSERLSARVVARRIDSDSQFDGCFDNSPPFGGRADDCTLDTAQKLGRASLHLDLGNSIHELSVSRSETERFSRANSAFPSQFTFEGQIDRAQLNSFYQVSDSTTASAGLEMREDSFDSSFANNETERDRIAAYAELQSGLGDRLFYTLGARYDDDDDFGTHTSYRATVAWLNPLSDTLELKLRGSAGTGFRAPSLSEIATNNGAFALNVPRELSEETSEGWEVGAELSHADDHRFGVVYFDNRIEDELVFQFVFGSVSGYVQTPGESTSKGVELHWDTSVTTTARFSGNITWNDTERNPAAVTAGQSDQRLRRPEWSGNLQWSNSFNLGDLPGQFSANYRISKDAIDTGNVTLDDYAVLDFFASVSNSRGHEFYVRALNALDDDYQEINGFNTSGSALFGGARFNF